MTEHTCIPQLALNNISLYLTFERRCYKCAAATLCIQYTLRYAVLSARAHTIPDRPAMVPHCSPCSPPSIPSWVISKVRFNTDLISLRYSRLRDTISVCPCGLHCSGPRNTIPSNM